MVKTILRSERIKVPETVTAAVERGRVSVQGPLGRVERDFSNGAISIGRVGGEIVVEASWPDRKTSALVGTLASHIRNMITGVTKGYTYKLKVIYAHFPTSLKIQDGLVIIENFGGERRPRIAKLVGDVKVEVKEDEVTVQGIDIRHVSQSAANIQQATNIKDRDPRVFLDGIYIYERLEGM